MKVLLTIFLGISFSFLGFSQNLVLEASFSDGKDPEPDAGHSERLVVNTVYESGIILKVTKDGQDLPSAEVTLRVIHGNLFFMNAENSRELKVTTDIRGTAKVALKTGSLGDGIVTVAIEFEVDDTKISETVGTSLLAEEGGLGSSQNLVLEASFSDGKDPEPETGQSERLVVNTVYESGIILKVTKDGQDLPSAEVTLRVIHGNLFFMDAENGRELKVTTDNSGQATVRLKTGSLGDGIVTVAVEVAVGESKTSKTIATSLLAWEAGLGSKRVLTDFIAGLTFHNSYNEIGESQGFDETSRFASLVFDTLWRHEKPNKVHTGMMLRASSFPVGVDENKAIPDGMDNEMTKTDTGKFADFSDSFTGSVYVHFQPKKFSSYSLTNLDPKNKYDAFRWGILGRGGITTRDKVSSNDNFDTVIRDWSLGFTFTHHKTNAPNMEADSTNISPMRYVEVSWSRFEDYGDLEDANRLIIVAGIQVNALGNSALPFNLGLYANFGEGEDDLRIFAGYKFGLDKLPGVF